MTEIRHTLRSLARDPGFTALAVLTLALGIGANTAVFSVVDAVLIRPLPYRDAHRLVEFMSIQDPGTPRQRSFSGMTRGEVEVWRQQTQIFEAIETDGSRQVVLDGNDPQRQIAGELSAGMLDFLGVSLLFGRSFHPEESIGGTDSVVIIGEAIWRTRFGGDRSVLGRTLSLDHKPYTIIGVMPASFRFPDPAASIWLPKPAAPTPGNPETGVVHPVARLNAGISLQEAQRRIDLVSARLEREQPRKEGWTTRVRLLDRVRVDGVTHARLLVLLGVVGFVMLIASANVGNLFLSRQVSRQREIAVRAAIGASRTRLMGQFLIEGFVVAGLGAAVAFLAAWWLVEGLGWISASILLWPTVFDPELNRRVLVFMTVVTGMAAIACAVVPALNVARRDQHASFLGGSRVVGFSPRHHRISQVLMLAEVALTFVLLLGAGLLANSFIRMVSVDPGFDTRNLLNVWLELPDDRYSTPTSYVTAHQQIVENLRGLPGVRDVIATGTLPPSRGNGGALVIDGDPTLPPRGSYSVSLTSAAPEHFRLLGIPLVEGRPFSASDVSGPPVAIVDRDTALRHWPGRSALGQRLRAYPNDQWRTVVGVVGRIFEEGEPENKIYLPLARESVMVVSPVVRYGGDRDTLMPLIRERVRAFDRDIIVRLTTVEESYSDLFAPSRVYLMLMSLFASVALLLAAIGLYGGLSYFVTQRKPEIGVRIALGADSRQVRRVVVREAMLPVGAGLLVGLVAALWLNPFMSAILYDVTPHDRATIAGVALFLTVVSLGAAHLPANRAANVDPIIALRSE
jgi:putative ABC transport system permease protein